MSPGLHSRLLAILCAPGCPGRLLHCCVASAPAATILVSRLHAALLYLPAGDADRAIFGAEANAATSRRQVLHDYAAWADSMIGHWRVEEDGHKSPNVSFANLYPQSEAARPSEAAPSSSARPSPPACLCCPTAVQVRMLVKPLLGMFHGEPRAKKWRAAVRQGSRAVYGGGG